MFNKGLNSRSITHYKLKSFRSLMVATVMLMLAACVGSQTPSPFMYAEPAVDANLTRAPRTLRLFFTDLPKVELSRVNLTGPNGELQLRGMHTMGADDLMMEIMGTMVNGDYTVTWTAVTGEDESSHQGSFGFTVSIN